MSSRTTFNLSYYCRESKANAKGQSPLELSININGQRKFINLPTKFIPSDFNKKKRPQTVTNLLREWDNKINEIISDMLSNNVPLTVENLRMRIKTGGTQSYTIEDCFEEYISIQRKRIGVSITPKAFRKYELARDEFFNSVNRNAEITTLSPSNCENFYNEICRKYNSSTSASYLSKVRTIINFAKDNGKIKINPLSNIKVRREKKAIEYLTEEEIERIRTTAYSTNALKRIANMFLIQCYSGLSFCDLEALTKKDIQQSNGIYFINKKRIKTGVEFTSVILKEGVELIKKYNYSLPLISNQKTNYFLKIIALEAKVYKNVSTHLGRKTYGSMLLNKGVRMETVAKALGHSNVRTTERYYAELHKESILNEVSKIF